MTTNLQIIISKNWLREWESNPRFPAYEAGEIPLLYPAIFGGVDEPRTHDLLLAKQMLSQLSYNPLLDKTLIVVHSPISRSGINILDQMMYNPLGRLLNIMLSISLFHVSFGFPNSFRDITACYYCPTHYIQSLCMCFSSLQSTTLQLFLFYITGGSQEN